jgi:hypothetical protein
VSRLGAGGSGDSESLDNRCVSNYGMRNHSSANRVQIDLNKITVQVRAASFHMAAMMLFLVSDKDAINVYLNASCAAWFANSTIEGSAFAMDPESKGGFGSYSIIN